MVSKDRLSPSQALSELDALPLLPACEHFAGSERFIIKALRLRRESGLRFDVTCDCEDGATSGQEQAHLQMILDTLKSSEFENECVGIRVHETSHPFFEHELSAVVRELGARLLYVTIPKVVDLADAQRAVHATQKLAESLSVLPPSVHLLIETHGALRDVFQIASLDGVSAVDFGLMDFVSAHRGALGRECMRSPMQFEHPLLVRAKSDLVAAAIAAGVVPTHNVTIEVAEPEQAYLDALRARRQFGFLRMWSVHPTQIEAIIRGMRVEAAELAFATEVLIRAQHAQWGPIRVGSELFDRASYRYLWDLVRRAVNEGTPISEEAKSAFFS